MEGEDHHSAEKRSIELLSKVDGGCGKNTETRHLSKVVELICGVTQVN